MLNHVFNSVSIFFLCFLLLFWEMVVFPKLTGQVMLGATQVNTSDEPVKNSTVTQPRWNWSSRFKASKQVKLAAGKNLLQTWLRCRGNKSRLQKFMRRLFRVRSMCSVWHVGLRNVPCLWLWGQSIWWVWCWKCAAWLATWSYQQFEIEVSSSLPSGTVFELRNSVCGNMATSPKTTGFRRL